MFNTCKIDKLHMACCPECQQWYEKNTMIVIHYNERNEMLVCVDCYEENHFIPPEPLKKGEEQCLKLSVPL